MAIVNSAGALGGFVGPLLIGALRERSGGYELSMLVLGAFLAAATIAVALLDPAWAERWMLRARPGARAAGDVEAVAVGGKGGGAAAMGSGQAAQ
jgi:nitrate/nitrite transporter NarK